MEVKKVMISKKYKGYVISDLHRYNPKERDFIKYLIAIPGFRYSFLMRTCRFLKNRSGIFWFTCYVVFRFLLRNCECKFGISIPYNTDIDRGLYIGHFGGIVVNAEAIIGRNCNINHGVTIGTAYGGKNPGTPKIGNNVYLGPGSKIIGGITIGDHVAVGANCVVTKTVPDNAVVVGVPYKVISYKGSSEYVVNTV